MEMQNWSYIKSKSAKTADLMHVFCVKTTFNSKTVFWTNLGKIVLIYLKKKYFS